MISHGLIRELFRLGERWREIEKGREKERDVPLKRQERKRKASQKGDLQNICLPKIISHPSIFSNQLETIHCLRKKKPYIILYIKKNGTHNSLVLKSLAKTREGNLYTSTSCIQESKADVSWSCLDDLRTLSNWDFG